MMSVPQTAGGIAMMTTAACLVIQAWLVRGAYGWKHRPWYNRALMNVVAAFLVSRSITVLHGGVLLNPLGIGLSASMAGWQFLELMRVITESWKRKADMLELGHYVENALHTGSAIPFYDLWHRRSR